MTDDQVRASWDDPPVPHVGADLPWWSELELKWLNKVVGPWRARRKRGTMPPPLTAEEIARRLCTMPMSYWTYDYEPGVRHLGPMAQDFAAAFGLGRSNRQINMVDANGVAVVTLQVLNRRVEALQREVARLSAIVESGSESSAGVSAGERNGVAGAATVKQAPGTGPGPSGRGPTMNEDSSRPAEDDVEAHRFYSSDRDIKHDVQPVRSEEEDGDDVEGHRIYRQSDRTIKHDVQPVVSEDDGNDDVEGHRAWNSNRAIKHDVQPVVSEDDGDDDVEGHAKASRF